jgi:hypothetical protein
MTELPTPLQRAEWHIRVDRANQCIWFRHVGTSHRDAQYVTFEAIRDTTADYGLRLLLTALGCADLKPRKKKSDG